MYTPLRLILIVIFRFIKKVIHFEMYIIEICSIFCIIFYHLNCNCKLLSWYDLIQLDKLVKLTFDTQNMLTNLKLRGCKLRAREKV